MRILYLTPYVPTPIRSRPYNLLRALASRGHDLTLLCIAQGERLRARSPSVHEQAALEELRALGIQAHAVVLPRWRSLLNCLAALPSPTPLQAVYCWSPHLAHRLRHLATQSLAPSAGPPTSPRGTLRAPADRPFEVLHIEHLRAARYGLWLRSAIANPEPPIVWDSVDCISHLFAQSARRSRSHAWRLITQVELPRTRLYEALLLRSFDRTTVVSPADAAALSALAPVGPNPPAAPSVLSNGVDLAYFSPDSTPRLPTELVFSGKMSYHANITAAIYLVREVLPLIWEGHPDVHLIIAGSDPPSAVQALSSPAVTVTGYVPDLRPFIRRAAVVIAPIVYGAGLQYKVLEAMACATPVVATPQTASALEARAGAEILVGATAEELAAHIVQLLNDPARGRQIGQAGRLYVEQHHGWARIAAKLEEIYLAEITRRPLPTQAAGWIASAQGNPVRQGGLSGGKQMGQ